MARVTISEDEWLTFRTLAMRKKRSVAAYLGHLVRKEIGRDQRVQHRQSLRQPDPAPETQGDEVDATWVPEWEI
jgi:hypothetical protein